MAGTAACGAQAAEPKIALRDAASAFAADHTAALQLSLPSSEDDVRAFLAASDPSSGASGGMTDEDLGTLLSSSLEIAYGVGEDHDSDADDEMRLVVNVGDLEAAELRGVDGLVYGRVDVEGLAERFPGMQEDLDSFRDGLAGADGMEPAPPSVQEPAAALLDGEWVSVDFQAYLDMMEEQLAAAGGDPEELSWSAEASAEARELIGSALKSAVSSVERREADVELGDHLVASVDLRTVYAELRTGLPELLDPAMAESAEAGLPPVEEVPDKQIDVSFWIRDGELSRVELDLAQFLDEPVGAMVLRADVLEEQEITAPADAVPFDVEALLAEMPAGGLAGGPAMGLDAYTVATWVDMDVAGLAYEDGGEPSVAYLPELLPAYEGMAAGLVITPAGERIQVALDQDVVCLTLSPDGMSEDIAPGPC